MTSPRDIKQISRAPIWTFLAITTVLVTLSYLVIFAKGDGNQTGGIFLLQFSPMLAALITKIIFQRNLRGMGWGWGKSKYQLAAYLIPFILALISFSLVWMLGFGGFYDDTWIAEVRLDLMESFGVSPASPYVVMLALIALNATFGMFVAFGAVGEEIGWRGFLVPELYKHYSYTKTSIISGVIWTVFHYPLLIGLIAPRLGISYWPMLVFTLVSSIGLTLVVNWLRIKSGSLWTAVIFHAALNIHIQGFFENLTLNTSPLTNYVSGEQGLMLALTSALVGYLFWRQRKHLPASA